MYCLHCYCTIQMHVELNSMLFNGRLRGGFRTPLTSVWEPFLQANECTTEVLLFLWCQNDVLSIFVYFDSSIATIKFNKFVVITKLELSKIMRDLKQDILYKLYDAIKTSV